MIKANFNIKKTTKSNLNTENKKNNDGASKEEWEDFMVKAGAAGSFMIFRSEKKNDELGLDEL